MSTVPTPAGSSPPPGWRFVHDGFKGGPVTFAELKLMVSAGTLLPSDRVLRPGGKQWESAGSLPGLFGGSPSAIKPAAATPVPAAAPKKRNSRVETKDEEEVPADTHVRLILIGVGGLCIFLLAAGLLVVCLSGDSPTQAQAPASDEPKPAPASPSKVPPKAQPKPVPAPVKLALTPRQKEIREAVTRGAAYLHKRVAEGGKFYAYSDQTGGADVGAYALVGLTLLESGASPTDPDVVKVADKIRRSTPRLYFTYSIALAILFLDRLHPNPATGIDNGDIELIRSLALQLIAGQNAKVGWEYYSRTLSVPERQKLVEALQLGHFQPGSKEFFTRITDAKEDYYDNSIGQFVTLALWAARKHNVPVAAPLALVEKRYRAQQRWPAGSWSYNDSNPHLPDTSTCAALIGLAVGRAIRDTEAAPSGQSFLQDPAVVGGMNHLKKVVRPRDPVPPQLVAERQKHTAELQDLLEQLAVIKDVEQRKPLLEKLKILDNSQLMSGHYFGGDNWGDLYFLWSLERMAVVYDLAKIGDIDWHEWGADFILKHQEPDGSWRERFPGVPDTCFAMLFLLRANVVKDLTDKLKELNRIPGVQPLPGQAPPKKE